MSKGRVSKRGVLETGFVPPRVITVLYGTREGAGMKVSTEVTGRYWWEGKVVVLRKLSRDGEGTRKEIVGLR